MTTMTSGIARKNGGTPEGARQGQMQMLDIAQSGEITKPNGKLRPQNFVGNADFAKKLRWKIENPAADSERWRITPKMAEAMLEWNTRNRPVSSGTVREYTAAMREGRWRYTGTTIAFSRERLLDGQNRLMAVVASGATIEALVAFGVPDDAFAFIDVGKKRSASDIFAINGVKNNAAVAAAIQWIIGYESGSWGNAAKGTISRGDHDQLYQSYLKHQGIQESTWVVSIFAKARVISPSMMCAIHYICAKKNKAQADEFFRKVGDGIGFSGKKDPAYKLHKALVDAAVSGERLGRKAGAAVTIKAWNAARLGRDPGAMRFGADEVFPKVI